MKRSLFPRLAWTGIRKNAQLYRPYILTCVGMVMMFYILCFLSLSPLLDNMSGGTTTKAILALGRIVIIVFSQIFLFYTNFFLIRRRNREFGLYNVLGMDKRGIGRIIVWESLIVSGISLALGLALGVAFSKLAELGLLNALHMAVDFTLSVSADAILHTLVDYGVIFFLIFLNALRLVRKSDPLALMRAESYGEKPPRANWVGALLGLALLGGAYWMAATIESPLAAIFLFFVAVVMVILATYLLLIAGSVTLCRFLQKRRGYYYKPEHFVSVSSMAYRMKRNGAGLASICILCTMVLVMISSTTSLYFGAEDSLRARYPRNIQLQTGMNDVAELNDDNLGLLRAAAEESCAAAQLQAENVLDYRSATLYGALSDGGLVADRNALIQFRAADYDTVTGIRIIPLEDYNRIMGANETLADGEALLWCSRMSYTRPTIQIGDARELTVKGFVPMFEADGVSAAMLMPSLVIFVNDFDDYIAPLLPLVDETGDPVLVLQWYYGFDSAAPEEAQVTLCNRLYDAVEDAQAQYAYAYTDCAAGNRSDFYATYGALFFIGIVLSILFLAAAVLIIYYKQVCEGYEDQPRFAIMRKVGMTRKAIRRSVNSQVLIVFFVPLLMAGVHLTFACPMVWKLLQLFNLFNLRLFIGVTAGAYLAFALLYAAVYRLTSNTYYRLVSTAE